MLAIELRASIDWAREMRGTMSMLMPVMPAACNFWVSSRSCRGCRKVTRIAPRCMSPICSSEGSLTARTMSDPHTVVESVNVAPAFS